MKKETFKSKYRILKKNNINNDNDFGEAKIVEFPNNFISNDEILETKITLDKDINTGYSTHAVFNGIRIEYRNLKLLEPLEAEVSLNFPYFKMHFSLEGAYSYEAHNSKSLDFNVSEEHHQLYYFPEVKEGIISYHHQNITNKTLEITLSLDFIYRVFRNSWDVLDILGDAIKKEVPFVFGDSSKKISPEIYTVIQQIKNCNVKKGLKRAYLEAKVIELLVLQINDLEEIKSSNYLKNLQVKHFVKIKAAKAFIEANIDSNLTIPFIAKNVGLNINYLKTEFKELYNETIFQYLTNLRMEQANDLVKYTKLPITEIANKVGYTYAQHFTKAFKKHFEKTPSKLRKEALTN